MDVYSEVGLLNHMVVLFFKFLRNKESLKTVVPTVDCLCIPPLHPSLVGELSKPLNFQDSFAGGFQLEALKCLKASSYFPDAWAPGKQGLKDKGLERVEAEISILAHP